jgi:S-formylglutathione hydrolase FrmB
MYSPTLDTVKMVDVILPPGYDTALHTYYPVIYYLHGWGGNQDAGVTFVSYMNSYLNQGTIAPFIMVKPSSWCEPFRGSNYTNSIIWGNYQDYIAADLISWVDSTFRTVPQKSHRGILGVSMGCTGGFNFCIDYPDVFRAMAGLAGGASDETTADSILSLMLAEHSGGPPYTYDFTNDGNWTQGLFLSAASITPNLNCTQSYVNPPIVDFPADSLGNPIDSTIQKIHAQSVGRRIRFLGPSDSVSFLMCCGDQDEWLKFPIMENLVDTMTKYNIDHQWIPFAGTHEIPVIFKTSSFTYLDSILGDPEIVAGIPEPELSLPEYRLWPNPAGGDIWVEAALPDAALFSVSLFDMEGKLVRVLAGERQAQGSIRLNLSLRGIPAGSYLLHIRKGHHHLYDKLIIH